MATAPPRGAFGLVHQAAGLAEVAFFGFLTDKGRFQRIESAFIRCGPPLGECGGDTANECVGASGFAGDGIQPAEADSNRGTAR